VTVQNGVPTNIGKAEQIKQRTEAGSGRKFILGTTVSEPVSALVPGIPIVRFNVRKRGTCSAGAGGVGLNNVKYGMHNGRDVEVLPNSGNRM